MPGVLVLEAMGQVAAMMMSAKPGSENLITFLTGVEKAKFRKPVKPGDQLVTTAEMIRLRGKMGKVRTIGRIDGAVAAEQSSALWPPSSAGSGEEPDKNDSIHPPLSYRRKRDRRRWHNRALLHSERKRPDRRQE